VRSYGLGTPERGVMPDVVVDIGRV
jgi:hypothetical protein